MTNYSSYPRFFVSVDCVIFGYHEGKLKVLTHQRPYEPGLGEKSLIGGFVQKDENLETAARRILKEFTGLDKVYLQQLAAFGEIDRDPGERVISVVYYVLINIEEYNEELAILHKAEWIDVDNLPTLCFDHNEMVERARNVLGEDIKDTPVAGKLLPRYFTLTQLQTLHESILGTTVDKRNFRRAIADKSYVQATNLIDKDSSRRGATLYEFNY